MTSQSVSTRVLVTGCSSGIGRAIALEAKARGHTVISTARDVTSIEDLPSDMQLELDVTSDASVEAAVTAAGSIDVLVNNAGISTWGTVEAAGSAEVKALFDTNVFGALRMVRACLPGMRMQGNGSILQISSAAGSRSTAVIGHYAASKAALDAYSAAMRIELLPFGIHVCSVLLGAVKSKFAQNRNILTHEAYHAIEEGAIARVARSRSDPQSAEYVASRILDAIEMPVPPLRVDGTGDAFELVRHRIGQTDEVWEETSLHSLLGADWQKRFV